MADIVEFRTSARRGDASRHAGCGSAEIVLFPGVRYEYWQEAASGPARNRSSARRERRVATRDLLEIEG